MKIQYVDINSKAMMYLTQFKNDNFNKKLLNMIIRTNDTQGDYKEINYLDIIIANRKGLIMYFKIHLNKNSIA